MANKNTPRGISRGVSGGEEPGLINARFFRAARHENGFVTR